MRPQPGIVETIKPSSIIPATSAARSAGAHGELPASHVQEPAVLPREAPVRGSRRLVMPSNERVARYLGASLGGALLGGTLFTPAPTIGALLGALAGAGVVTFRMRHATS